MTVRLLLVAFLLAHAAIHVSFLTRRPPATAGGPAWPFELERSWALSPLGIQPEVTRLLGVALVAATIAGFALAAGAVVGFLPSGLWAPVTAAGAVASLALLLIFFNPWFALGVLIDIGLLWAVLVAEWSPDGAPVT